MSVHWFFGAAAKLILHVIRVKDLRVKAMLTVMVMVVLFLNLRLLNSALTSNVSWIGTDAISRYEKRFEGLRKALPRRGVVVYTDDFRPVKDEFKAYFLAQYALSPIVLFHPRLPTSFYSKSMLAQNQRFFIENMHDPINEPFLIRLFPAQFRPGMQRHMVVDPDPSQNQKLVLIGHFGNDGVRLYESLDP
jgi:hypothetical protein